MKVLSVSESSETGATEGLAKQNFHYSDNALEGFKNWEDFLHHWQEVVIKIVIQSTNLYCWNMRFFTLLSAILYCSCKNICLINFSKWEDIYSLLFNNLLALSTNCQHSVDASPHQKRIRFNLFSKANITVNICILSLKLLNYHSFYLALNIYYSWKIHLQPKWNSFIW